MRISTKGRYALRLMVDLVQNDGDELIRIKDISKRQGISEKYLEQIIAHLKKAGYVKSLRGAQGGYRLAMEPKDYTVGMILRLTEGSMSLVNCLDEESATCERMDFCVTRRLWTMVNEAIQNVIDHVTLQDLVDWEKEKEKKTGEDSIVNFCEVYQSSDFFQMDYRYSKEKGYGFVGESWFYPVRHVDLEHIQVTEKGIYSNEKTEEGIYWKNENDYNFGGLIFRRRTVPGVYRICVTLTEDSDPAWIAVTGMRAEQLEKDFPWDPAEQISRKSPAQMNGNVWSYDFVSGNGVLDIEIEPREREKRRVGVKEIQIEVLLPKQKSEQETEEEKTACISEVSKPTIFLLGDSTVQSFIFEEAIMSGWGQIFDDFFDLSKVNVVNYSMGGRSLKTMYQEGRLNDLLLAAKRGDYLLLQSGHNDEARDEQKGMDARFGKGNDEASYIRWLEEVYIPVAKIRGMQLLFVTPMTRIYSEEEEKELLFAGFQYSEEPGIHFPGIMKTIGKRYHIPVLDLYEKSITYLKGIGKEAAKAMFLSVEAGETPGKTNSGSFANGNPNGKCDGTHAKEALAKQWARLVLTEICDRKLELISYLKEGVLEAVESGEERNLFPEISTDVLTGENAYYRNQIEKMIKLGVFSQDKEGKFWPKREITEGEFCRGLEVIWKITLEIGEEDEKKTSSLLTRERMAYWVWRAYMLRFGKDSNGEWKKPKYMTDYNRVNLPSDNPYYDPNLDGESAQYDPLVVWEYLADRQEISEEYREIMKEVYKLGLMRSERGICRGKMINGIWIEPTLKVSREKAAKELYFLYVLGQDYKKENDH